jgi:gliding motility-associated-like protein
MLQLYRLYPLYFDPTEKRMIFIIPPPNNVYSIFRMKKCVGIAFIFFLITFSAKAQNFNYKFCLVQKDAVNIAFEFTVCNNTAAPLNAINFVFNWPGVSNVTVDNGLDVIKNGNTGIVELVKQTWAQPLNPGCNNKFTVRMNYTFGMFPPVFGTLNGDTIQGITCYIPPSFENFNCKKNFNGTCFLNTGSEIKIGEGTVRAWNSTRDVYVPTNRKSWPIAMAVAHTMFNNLMGFDCMTPNEYFATAMQESSCGCDGGVTAPAWVTNAYNIQPTNYCADLTHGVAAGFFQEEYGTGWVELEKDIPCFIPTADFDKFIIGSKFETQAIGKVYHDFNNISYWQYIKCWNPIDFLKNAKDPYATEKLIALGYNRGLNSGEIGNLLTTSRAPAMAATNILPYLNPGGVGWVYAEQISRISAVLDNNMGAVDPADPIASSVPYPGVHSFHGFYDAPISWMDISNYIDAIAPMYAGVGLNATAYKSKIQQVFNSIKAGSDVSFRYELSPVIDAIVLNLPAFDPKFGLGGMYVNSGGSACKYPTAALSKSDTVCMGNPLTLTVKLTGMPPWSFSYLNPKGVVVTLTNISTSPYVFTVKDTGAYHLTAVNDAVGKGEAICQPVIKAYIGGGGAADLVAVSTVPCGPQSIQIKFKGTGPFDIEYTINGAAQTPVNGITQNPYTLIPSPAALGTYILTRLKVNGCDIQLKDTVIIDPLNTPKISITGNTSICQGQSTQLTVKSTGGITKCTWSPATGLNAADTSIVKASPAKTTQYVITVTDAKGCTAKDSVTVIVNPSPIVTVTKDTAICKGEKITLNASGGTSYSWTPATGLNVTNTASVIASPVTTTQYVVTVTDAKSCTVKDSVVLTVNPLPVIKVSADTSVCLGEPVTLNASGGSTYSWTPATGLNVTTGASVIASPAVSTQYVVTGKTVSGCSANDTVNVTILPCGFLVKVIGDSVCDGNCYTLKTIISGGTSPYTYNWQPVTGTADSLKVCPTATSSYTVTVTDKTGNTSKGIGIVKVITKPTIFVTNDTVCKGDSAIVTATGAATYSWSNGSTGATIKVNPLVTTTYTVTGTTLKGCVNTAIATVSIKPKPVVDFSPDTAGCVPLIVKFKNLSTDMVANSTCSWDFGNSKKSQTCDPHEVVYTSPGTYTVSLTVNNGGCSAKVSRPSIMVYPTPKAFFTADPIKTDIYDPIITFINESDAKSKNNWSFGDGTVDSTNIPVYKHTYKEEGTYHVCLKAAMNGCAGEYCTDVLINPGWSFYIPNAFVPDSNGPNSLFKGVGENISAYSLLIFNRWGNLVFETSNLNNGWNGNVNNSAEIAQQDVYVYKVRFKDGLNKTHEYIGSVTLLK